MDGELFKSVLRQFTALSAMVTMETAAIKVPHYHCHYYYIDGYRAALRDSICMNIII